MTTRVRRLPRRRDDVRLSDDATCSVLTDLRRGTSHVLNPTASAIWELCDGTTTLDELIDAICQVFSVPHGVALRDVAAALAQLEEAGLVSWAPDDGQEV